jgi:hypothetical protein
VILRIVLFGKKAGIRTRAKRKELCSRSDNNTILMVLLSAIALSVVSLAVSAMSANAQPSPSNSSSGTNSTSSNETNVKQMGICQVGAGGPCNGDTNSVN